VIPAPPIIQSCWGGSRGRVSYDTYHEEEVLNTENRLHHTSSNVPIGFDSTSYHAYSKFFLINCGCYLVRSCGKSPAPLRLLIELIVSESSSHLLLLRSRSMLRKIYSTHYSHNNFMQILITLQRIQAGSKRLHHLGL